ncbi:MAG: beta-N-acetylglucosaminidase domain-containing protein [Betaproteobacteria bacterium]|nr:beta-N-acetylglucosaminidase domain-containing protein [Betaproteobacteria bacterium]
MCPTYYSDDVMLDTLFGARPRLLEDLGRRLDPRVGVYWTGEEICSARQPKATSIESRSPAAQADPGDNYPVNDGPRMSRFLHLRAFRPAGHDAPPRRPRDHAPAAATVADPAPRRELSGGHGVSLHGRVGEAARAMGGRRSPRCSGRPARPPGPGDRPPGRGAGSAAGALPRCRSPDGRGGGALAGGRVHRGPVGGGFPQGAAVRGYGIPQATLPASGTCEPACRSARTTKAVRGKSHRQEQARGLPLQRMKP